MLKIESHLCWVRAKAGMLLLNASLAYTVWGECLAIVQNADKELNDGPFSAMGVVDAVHRK